jgi:N utilization substance protein B
LQVLYSLDLNDGLSPRQALAQFWRGFEDETDTSVVAFAEELVEGTMGNLEAIDAIVQRASRNWRLERMARVDRNLLRLATYELQYVPAVPAKVVINEAIEVAKRYGTAESPAFVNGLLDRISQELKRS